MGVEARPAPVVKGIESIPLQSPISLTPDLGETLSVQLLHPPLSSEVVPQSTPDTLHIPVDPAHQFPVSDVGDLGDFADQLLSETRLPLTQVREKAYIPNKYGNHGVLGSWETGGRHKGRLAFYKDMNKIPAIAQFGVAFHEGSHASSPFNPESADDYSTEDNRLQAQENVIAIASQTKATGIFLNGYHAYIYHLRDQVQNVEEFSQWAQLYLEETHAIASELAVTNYQHLQDVEQRQFAALKATGKEQEFVPLTSRMDDAGNLHESGIDTTLKILTKFDDVDQMHRYFRSIRAKYGGTKTPFHDVPDEPFTFAPIIPGTEMIVIGVIYVRRSRPDVLETPEERLRRLQDYSSNVSGEQFAA